MTRYVATVDLAPLAAAAEDRINAEAGAALARECASAIDPIYERKATEAAAALADPAPTADTYPHLAADLVAGGTLADVARAVLAAAEREAARRAAASAEIERRRRAAIHAIRAARHPAALEAAATIDWSLT
ncbi:hypothetical protein [Segnochrobactrum spirostomi]|uniref:Uncharacterized protein n=1 Tax=Segnochrobactrum spirostomi TaxID=2608987 RepID=A0A6A7Y7K4_9HYPH|nr:hypothetical protein [Segnochrobactrum spirostomi]MQT13632.1 hypothetical protein [Segnochrobactrum spirostomi]